MQQPNNQQAFLRFLGETLRVHFSLKKWKKKTAESKRRFFGICELVTTQADYNRDLHTLLHKIQKPLVQCGAVSMQEQMAMFPNIEGMIQLSNQLLVDTEQLKSTWNVHSTLLGPTMIRYSKFLQIYSEFFKCYSNTRDRLQYMLVTREDVKGIQAALGKMESFENIWSKPSQRPLKYKLLLSAYLKELWRAHPDYSHVKQAIKCYQDVSQRNNKAMEHKERREDLLKLQARFPGIIDSQPQQLITKFEATLFEYQVDCHVLSNSLVVVSISDEIPPMRVFFDQNSFVQALPDSLCFKNRLYVCGHRYSVHLCFKDKPARTHCENQLQGIINELYKAEHTRTQLSSKSHRSTYLRDSVQVRRSYTQLPEILPKPPRFLVLGAIRRRYACVRTFKIYIIVKVMLPFGEDNGQVLYVDLQDLLGLEEVMRNLYPMELKKISTIQQHSKMISAPQMKSNGARAIQHKCVHATVLLNFLFRDPQIVKRTDIIAHKLRIGQAIWLYCRYHLQRCACSCCRNGEILTSVLAYQRELADRQKQRLAANTFYCPFRTIHAQNMLAQTDPSLAKSAVDRLFVLRCESGELDYRAIDSTPGARLRKKILVRLQRIQGERSLQLILDTHQRVGQVLQACSRALRVRLEDYQLFLCVNKNSYMLGRDQVLWRVLENETTAEENFFSFFRTAFGEKEDLTFRLYLRKVWVLEPCYQKQNFTEEGRLGLVLQEFMVRLRRQEIKLSLEDTSNFYACYYVFQTVGESSCIAEEQLKGLIAPKKWKAMEVQQRCQLLQIVQVKVQKLRGKSGSAQILKNIWSYLVKMGDSCPGWSALYFNATIVAHPQYQQGFQVRIGADLNRLYIKQAQKMITVLEYPLNEVTPLLIFSSWQMHLLSSSFTYIFTGDSLFHLEDIISTYQLYKSMQE